MAWQIIVEVEGENIRLIRKRRVDMLVPGNVEPPASAGLYLELRNDHDEPLFRQNLPSRLEHHAEVFSPDRTIQRVEAPERTRTMLLIVPDEGVRSVTFMARREYALSTQRMHEQSIEDSRELARFDLTEEDS